MYEIPRIITVSGRTIKIAHLDLPTQPLTYLASDVAAAGVTLTVLDNVGFANTNLILIGTLGSETCEIKKVNAAVTAGTSLTSTALTFAHSTGAEVRKVLFNQYKIYGTTTTTFITDNLIATVDITPNAPYTTYVNASTEYAYYWVAPYDSENSVTGDNSDYVARTTGYPSNTVGSLIESALTSTKKKKGGVITDEWLMNEINDCSEYIASKLKRWSHLQCYDYPLGQSLLGTNSWTLPTDIQEKNSIKSILSVRIGTNENLEYKDKREWNNLLRETAHTQVTTQAVATDTTLYIDNSYDFPDEGSVDIFVAGVKYTIEYDDVTRSATAGALTGIPATGDGSITVTVPADTEVWYGESESQPLYFTVYDGKLYTYPLSDSSYDYNNVYLDYHTSRTKVDTAGDAVEPTRYLLYKHWLAWKLKALDNSSGSLNIEDGDFQLFTMLLNDMIGKEVSGQKFRMKPRVNKISYSRTD